jgi:hypothetical protein
LTNLVLDFLHNLPDALDPTLISFDHPVNVDRLLKGKLGQIFHFFLAFGVVLEPVDCEEQNVGWLCDPVFINAHLLFDNLGLAKAGLALTHLIVVHGAARRFVPIVSQVSVLHRDRDWAHPNLVSGDDFFLAGILTNQFGNL